MPVSPPRPKGPPLNALRAFEAAARLGGFSAAAEELCVTPGAITQHIKALEDWTGVPLFERRAQGVKLTAEGARLKPQFTAAFDMLGQAVLSLREASCDKPVVNIATLPSLAQLWLSPRLPQLRQAFPQLQFSVTALERPPNLLREMFDWSLFLTEDDGDGIVLEEDVIFPVCTPEVSRKISTPEDLMGQTLLFDESWKSDWALWAEHAGLPQDRLTDGPSFSLYALALEEARNGAGVLLGHACLVDSDLESGRLVAPIDLRVPTGRALVLKTIPGRKSVADSFVTIL